MSRHILIFLSLLIFLPILSYSQVEQDQQPKNVILVIGNGLGLSQMTAGMYKKNNRTAFEHFSVIGIHKCHNNVKKIADPFAASQAIASGATAFLEESSKDKENNPPAPTLLDKAKSSGRATGIVITASLTSATPAAFLCPRTDLEFPENVAAQIAEKDIDLLIGGGMDYFSKRTADGRDLSQEMQEKGTQMVELKDAPIKDINLNPKENAIIFTAPDDPPTKKEGREYLLPATEMATEFLANHSESDGFFLVIESSQIAKGGLSNDIDLLLEEVIEFDDLVDLAYAFARKNSDTLLIVTANYEAGGFAINPGSTVKDFIPAFNSKTNTGALIPVFAFGPGANAFSGIYENTKIHEKLIQLMGIQ